MAVRVPNHPIPRTLAGAIGGSIIGTSANISNSSNLLNASQVDTILGDRLEFILDGGPVKNDAPSTVLDLTRSTPTVVREGSLSIREIEDRTRIRIESQNEYYG